MKRFVATLMLGALSSWAAADTDHFAQRFALDLGGNAAYYTLTLPDTVYAASQRTDLGDVRVFNGAGEPVPYSLDGRRAAAPAPTLRAVKWFALPTPDAAAPSAALGVTIASDGSLRAAPAAKAAGAAAGTQADLIDLGRLDGSADALQVHLGNDSYQGRVSVDASANLRDWQALPDAQLLKVGHGGDTLTQERIALDGLRVRYVRLHWLDRAPQIASIDVEVQPGDTAATANASAPRQWREGVAATPGAAAGEYLFDTGGAYPVDRLRLNLPQPNTVARVSIYSRPDAQTPWRELTQATLYRLHGASGEQMNPPLEVEPDSDREWRVSVDMRNGGLGAGALTVAVGWRPAVLTFVARGEAPFTLGVGNGALTSVAAKREDIVIDESSSTASARVGAALPALPQDAPAPPAADRDAKRRYVLWAALILAVGSLGAMAWRLARGASRG